jgi:hypothetical protein
MFLTGNNNMAMNIVAECLALLLHMWEVLVSNLGLETG